MKKNSSSKSAFFIRRFLIGVALCLFGVFLALVGFGQNRSNNAHSNGQGAGLTTADSPDVTPTPTPTPTATPFMTFTVTNTNDSGAGSLRQAILDSNANPPPT